MSTTITDRLRRRTRGVADARRGERGAAAVEFALILPIVAALTFGLIDGSLTFFRWTAISQASRAGARTVSEMGTNQLADYKTLQAVAEMLSNVAPEDIDRVVIYNADDGRDDTPMDNPPPAACLTSATGVADTCNVYTAADLGQTREQYAAAGRFASWNPLTRDDEDDADGVDYVGVYVRAELKTPTKMLGKDRTVSEFTVVRLEPRPTPYP